MTANPASKEREQMGFLKTMQLAKSLPLKIEQISMAYNLDLNIHKLTQICQLHTSQFVFNADSDKYELLLI